MGAHVGPKVNKSEMKKTWSEKNMFFEAKSFQNRAQNNSKIYEKTLLKTMPKTRRPIIKNIIRKEVPEPQKTLCFVKKN